MRHWLLSLTALVLLGPQPLRAQVAIEGNLSDITWLVEQIAKLRNYSPEFNRLWSEVEDYSRGDPLRITIEVASSRPFLFGAVDNILLTGLSPFDYGQVSPPSPLVDYTAFRSGQPIDPNGWGFRLYRNVLGIDRQDVEVLPVFEQRGAGWEISGGAPSWAVTQESVIAHEIGEYFHGLSNSHCKYRCTCRGGPTGDSHHVGKVIENAVRRAFGQNDARPEGCGDSQEPHVDVGPHRVEFVLSGTDLQSVNYVP